VKERELFQFLHVWGAHLRGGAHHHLEEAFLLRGRLLQRQGQRQGKFRGKQQQRQSKGSDKDKGKQEEEGSPRQGAPYFTRLVGKSSRNSKAPESGCYCTRFTCLCFLCCTFCFEAFYIHISQTGFPRGGFIQGHVDQKYLCQIYACLEV
jgi:hypothetical protein